jgi:hypothetical protein
VIGSTTKAGGHDMRFDRWQIPLLVTGVIFCVGAYCSYPADTSEAVAAWVQGLGSLLAIGAAVWIYAKQYHDKRTDELAETRAFVQSIHTELSPLWNDWKQAEKKEEASSSMSFQSPRIP